MKSIFLIIFLLSGFFVLANSSYAENNLQSDIFTRLIDLTGDGESTLVLTGTGEIWNPNDFNVSIGFPNTCQFEIRMYFENNTMINSGARLCGQALTGLLLLPGSIRQEMIQISFSIDINQFSKFHSSHRFRLEFHLIGTHKDLQINIISSYLVYGLMTSPSGESKFSFEYDDPPKQWGQITESNNQFEFRINGNNFKISIYGFVFLLFYKKKQTQ